MANTSSLAELFISSVLEVVGEEETQTAKRPHLESEKEQAYYSRDYVT